MGGKTATSTQQVQVPPEVLAQYQAVNSRATQTANTPFQTYGGQFVAPVNQQQQTGIAGTNAAANEAQPYFGAATGQLLGAQSGTTGVNNAALGLAGASAGQVNPSDLDTASINKYLSPYLQDVVGSESALLNQNNQQQQAGQLGTAIQSGAFGGDRTGIAAANLEQQQNLANANIYSGLLNQGYNTALGTAQQQQGVQLQAGQANRAALANAGQEIAGIGQTQYGEGANTASELAGLGTGAQTAGLQGANAQIAAGTVQQQTQQAQDTALYNQFLQQQSYPFQVDQFLANIAEGTGALSGSTTTTQQPGGFFSDRRLKHDIRKIGETFDKQPIYSYKMHGDNRTHVGLIAQNVEKKHPGAVGLAAGYKTVDYGRATEDAADRGHFYAGGVASGGGRVYLPGAYAAGGSPSIVSAGDLSAILAAQEQMYAPISGGASVYGGVGGNVPRGGSSRVPAPSGAVPHLVTAEGGLRPVPTGMQNAKNLTDAGDSALKLYRDINRERAPKSPPKAAPPESVQPSTTTTTTTPPGVADADVGAANDVEFACRGGVMGRKGYDAGGSPDDGLDAVLAAQQRMYQPQHQNRDIPAGVSGGHQLAVANGSPTAPPSGSSNVNQALGLGQKGYQVYHHFNTPSGGGVSPTPAQAAAEGPATDTAAASAAQTGAAADAAAPAAAEVAAPAAADAAGAAAGSAAGAAGGAAVDAGATEAAALAAEYAAADAAVALAAAKRGGRIRGKFDTGGTPYMDDGSLDIPDQENSNRLQTAGPIKKQPTGLQTAMTLGDPNQASTIAGSMFSNEALARGGGVSGRRRYDDGGDVADHAADPDMLPEQTVTAPRPDPVVKYTAGLDPVDRPPIDVKVPDRVDTGVAASKDAPADSQDHWWKHSENVVPLLTGLAAMGTAPTRSLGVALASGLGAGAQSWLPTHQQEADVQAQQLQNQRAQFQLDTLRAPSPTSGAGGPPPQPTFSGTGADPSAIVANAQKRFAFTDIYTPQEQAAINQNQTWQRAGLPNSLQSIQVVHQARMQNQQTAQQQGASAIYQAAYQAASAPTGAALSKVREIDPLAADQISKMATNPQDADKLARTWASQVGNAVHQYSGRPIDDTAKDGIPRDKLTSAPLLGGTPVGVSADEQVQNLIRLHGTTVDTGANAKPTPAQLSRGALGPGTRPIAPGSPGYVPPGGSANIAPAAVSGTSRISPATRSTSAAKTPQTGSLDFSDAPNKPIWANNPNYVLSEDEKPTAHDYGTKVAELKAEASQLPHTEATMIQAQRALNLLPNAKTGPGTDTMSAVQTALGNMTGSQFVSWLDSNPSAHAILQKELGQEALNDRLTEMKTAGASVRLGAQQDNIILNKLSASTEMPKAAIAGILNWEIEKAKYDQARQAAIPSYLAQGKDATLFDSYYAAPGRHPLSSVLTTGAPRGTALPTRPGQQTSGLPATNTQGWALHRDAYGNHAYVSPDGKQFQEVK